MRQHIGLWLLSLFFALAGLSAPAAAQSCTAVISNVSFGTINLTTGLPSDTTATMDITCTGTASTTVRVCPNLGAGSGGTSGGGAPRLMTGTPSGNLAYNLYQDSGHSVVWGTVLGGTGSATPPVIDIVLDGSGNGSIARTVYGRVSGGQQTLAPGTFNSSFSGTDATIAAQYESGQTCASIGTSNATNSSFAVSASYPSTCTISADSMSFGAITSTVYAPIDAQASIITTCSASTPYQVALDNGVSGASQPTQREMLKGSDRLYYGIYKDSQRTQAWGGIPNANTVAGTGTGSSSTVQAYGRIPTQSTPPSGTYTDTIIVTIDY